MIVLVAPNSFKETLDSTDIARIIKLELTKTSKQFRIIEMPLADGGIGTCKVLTRALAGRYFRCRVSGPTGKKVSAVYGYVANTKTAIIELAQAAGIHLVPPTLRNPLIMNTRGVGELVMRAVNKGCQKIVLGVGDSATIDCGIGALSVLGFKFLRRNGAETEPTCRGLLALDHIEISHKENLGGIEFVIGADVDNTLTGRKGALLYARQKGAKPSMMPIIDTALKNFRTVVLRQFRVDVNTIIGSGAAGGIGGACAVLLKAKLQSGFEIVSNTLSLDTNMKHCDVVITGEGTIDRQSFYGKTVKRVVDIASSYDKPVILIAGHMTRDALLFSKLGVIGYYSLTQRPTSTRQMKKQTPQLLIAVVRAIGRRLCAM